MRPIRKSRGVLLALVLLAIWGGGPVRSQDAAGRSAQQDSIYGALGEALRESLRRGEGKGIAHARIELGTYYGRIGLYSLAMDQYNQALEALSDAMEGPDYALVTLRVGEVQLERNEFAEALGTLEEARDRFARLGDDAGIARTRALIGTCYEKLGDYAQALAAQEESLEAFRRLGDSLGMALVEENIGSVHEDLGEYGRAKSRFEAAYGVLRHYGDARTVNVLNNLGDVHRKTGDLATALTYTQRALELAETLGDTEERVSAHRDLAKTFADSGRYEEAYAHQEQAAIWEAQAAKDRNDGQLNTLQSLNRLTRSQHRIELLEAENATNRARQAGLWIAVLSLLALTGAGYYYRRRRKRARIRLQRYERRLIESELERKETEERALQRDIQMKTAALSRYSLQLAEKNEVLQELSSRMGKMAERRSLDFPKHLKDMAQDINRQLATDNEWDEFATYFTEIHPEFGRELSERASERLSPAELRLAMLLRLNLSSKEIASILRITPDSVRVARYRLRKKLPLHQGEELVTFLLEL